ncbi:MAG: VWA domain-containing protein [Myxococcota bacterium]
MFASTPDARARLPLATLALCGLLAAHGCGVSDADLTPGPGSTEGFTQGGFGAGVGQSGAQDIGEFRAIVNAGQLPAPETLDEVGFFNEHKFELPAPDCGDDVCLHARLGVWGNFISGANCTMAMLGLNTPLDPDDFPRKPQALVLVVEDSTGARSEALDIATQGIAALADAAHEEDTITLVRFGDEAEVIFTSTPGEDPDRSRLRAAVVTLGRQGAANMYAGLKLGLEQAAAQGTSETQARVVLFSASDADAGVTEDARAVHLASTYAERGVGITTIATGGEADTVLLRQISEVGAGTYYFVDSATSAQEIFTEEVRTFRSPIAEDITITFDVAPAYRFRAAYGTRVWEGTGAGAEIRIPALFVASRTSIDDVSPGGGRRGGGGAIVLEVTPTANQSALSASRPMESIGQFTMTYTDPRTGDVLTQQRDLVNPLAAGVTPEAGAFDDAQVEKAFVVLNAYVGTRMALERAANGAPLDAASVLEPLLENMRAWNEGPMDADIADDIALMTRLQQTIERRIPPSADTRGRDFIPPRPWPRD